MIRFTPIHFSFYIGAAINVAVFLVALNFYESTFRPDGLKLDICSGGTGDLIIYMVVALASLFAGIPFAVQWAAKRRGKWSKRRVGIMLLAVLINLTPYPLGLMLEQFVMTTRSSALSTDCL